MVLVTVVAIASARRLGLGLRVRQDAAGEGSSRTVAVRSRVGTPWVNGLMPRQREGERAGAAQSLWLGDSAVTAVSWCSSG
jgi:hypothetical protein